MQCIQYDSLKGSWLTKRKYFNILIVKPAPNYNMLCVYSNWTSADPEGGGGTGGPDPPEKSQAIWVSIGTKQLDPPGKSWTPPPGNVGPLLEDKLRTTKKKKKKIVKAFFCQIDMDPP